MIYIVNYMYVYDDYKDAGASTTVLGLFTSEETAYKCAVQKYCEKILERIEDKSELEERLLGTPKEMFEILDDWRDSLFEPEFTRDRVGPMVSVDSQETQSEWDLAGYFESASLTAGGMIAEILGSLTLTSTKKVGSKGIKELIAQVPDKVSMEDAERVLSSVEVTSSAQTQWNAHVASIEAERQRVEAEERAEHDRLFEGSLREFGSGVSKHAMMVIPKGEFMMGAVEKPIWVPDDEKPRHKVILTRDFLIGKYAVTQSLWESVMGSNPSCSKGPNRPVEQVSWFDVVCFCNKLSELEGLEPAYTINGQEVTCNWTAKGYRLPTEAEWEYSARGGEYHTYAGSDNIDEVAWYNDNSGGETHPVGQKKPNAFGLYDMSGNVLEWVWDWYGGYSTENNLDSVENPTGNPTGSDRIARGGNCFDSDRASKRRSYAPARQWFILGFRICRFT